MGRVLRGKVKPDRGEIRVQRGRSHRGILRPERRDGRKVKVPPIFMPERMRVLFGPSP